MSMWILIYIVLGANGYPVATGAVSFHSQAACQKAADTIKHTRDAYCFEDPITENKDGKEN